MKWTYQSLLDQRMSVTAYCHNSRCNHSAKLDLERFKERFGPDAPAMRDDILPKIHCSKCKGKKLGLIYTPPRPGDAGYSPTSYAKSKGI